jgi:phospho-N-acetylmuramoyl-pentapeptide-transferase
VNLIAAIVVSWLFVGLWISLMQSLRLGKQVRADGPQSHLSKTGTAHMGGAAFLMAAAVVYFALGPDRFAPLWVLVGGFALLGFVDDLAGSMRRPLRAREKTLLGGLMAVIFAVWASRQLATPYLPIAQPYADIALITLVIYAAANAFNFADGVDGLLGTLSAVMLLAFFNQPIAQSMVGALLGFLWYNAPKAKVFMGDVGSNALGVLVAGLMVLDGKLWYLPLVALYPVVATLSVMIQVNYFRRTGKRFFKMSPIHHHFELSGWSEAKIVFRFGVVTALTTACAMLLWGGLK